MIVYVSSPKVEQALLIDGGKELATDDQFLNIFVALKNKSAGRIDYHSWSDPLPPGRTPRLTDNFGHNYKQINFGLREVAYQQKQASFGPGEDVIDLLVFEPTPANIQYLQLELPTAAFGGESANMKFRIPAALIKRAAP